MINVWDTVSAHIHPLGCFCSRTILTHWGRVTHICVSRLPITGSDNGLSPGRRQAVIWTNWNIVNWTLRNKLQWKFNRNSNIFIHENAFESFVCEMAAILSRPQCVNDKKRIGQVASDILLIRFAYYTKDNQGVPGLVTDPPCGVWGRGWTSCLLYGDPMLGLGF